MVVGLTDAEIRKANKWQQVGSSDHKINSKFQRKPLDSYQWRVNSICSAFPLPRQLAQRYTQMRGTDALGPEQLTADYSGRELRAFCQHNSLFPAVKSRGRAPSTNLRADAQEDLTSAAALLCLLLLSTQLPNCSVSCPRPGLHRCTIIPIHKSSWPASSLAFIS